MSQGYFYDGYLSEFTQTIGGTYDVLGIGYLNTTINYGITANTGTNEITVENGGDYTVTISSSFTVGDPFYNTKLYVFVNGNATTIWSMTRQNTENTMTISGILELNANDIITLRAEADGSGSTSIQFYHTTISIASIDGVALVEGPTGVAGADGSATNTGAQGPTGDFGPTGLTGPQGIDGSATNTGAQGPTGDNSGFTGATGEAGISESFAGYQFGTFSPFSVQSVGSDPAIITNPLLLSDWAYKFTYDINTGQALCLQSGLYKVSSFSSYVNPFSTIELYVNETSLGDPTSYINGNYFNLEIGDIVTLRVIPYTPDQLFSFYYIDFSIETPTMSLTGPAGTPGPTGDNSGFTGATGETGPTGGGVTGPMSYGPPSISTGGTMSSYDYNGTRYQVHVFTTDETITVSASGYADLLLVGGGGGGSLGYSSAGGGGGGGGYLATSYGGFSTYIPAGTHNIVIGAGGAGGSVDNGLQGGDTTFLTYTALGGGFGGGEYVTQQTGNDGGCGGGGWGTFAGGAGSAQGYAGADGQGASGGGGGGGTLYAGAGTSGGYGTPYLPWNNTTMTQIVCGQGGNGTGGADPPADYYGMGGGGDLYGSGSAGSGSDGIVYIVYPIGQIGPTGPQGLTGDNSGFTGATGTLGPTGDNSGFTGATGTQGPTGPADTGLIRQVLQSVKTDTFSLSSTTFTDITGLAQSITPASTSNKVLVMLDLKIGTNNNVTQVRLLRDGTPIYVGDAAGSRTPALTSTYVPNDNVISDVTGIYLDSPNSTSSVAYTVQIRTDGGGATYVNRNTRDIDADTETRTASSLTLWEIKG
jgi:hypothetical protein